MYVFVGATDRTWKFFSIRIHLLLTELILLGFFFICVTDLVSQLTKSRKESRDF